MENENQTQPTRRIWAYLRVSTDAQDINNQKHGILEYANNHNLHGLHFVEDAISGKIKWHNRKVGDLRPSRGVDDLYTLPRPRRDVPSRIKDLRYGHGPCLLHAVNRVSLFMRSKNGRTRMNRIVAALLAALALGLGQFAHAALLDGNCIEYQYFFPHLSHPYRGADNGLKCVGAGVEVTNIVDGVGTMDIFDDSILIDFTTSSFSFAPGRFNGFRLRDVTNSIAPFTSVTIDPSTNMVGLDASRITFDDDNIFVNWESLDFFRETIVRLNLNLNGDDHGGAAVPEPVTVLLLASGLSAAGAFARKSRSRRA